jgi:DNA modification methylase
VGWTITNPPWSLARRFLKHAYEVSDNVVFLITLNHVLSLRVRIAEMYEAGFGIKEILLCPTPAPPWAQGGFQLGAVHFQRGYRGEITWGWLDDPNRGALNTGQESASPIVHPPRVVRGSAFAIPLADKTVQTVISSPPYFRLRQYPGSKEGDFGREATVQEYVDHTVAALREIRRVLRDDGLVFWVISDCYHGGGRGVNKKLNPFCDTLPFRGQGTAKSLCLIPQRVEIALADAGWIIRSIVIWEKPNAVPESVRDRPTACYEHVVILTKSNKYFWNREEAREASVCWEKGSLGGGVTPSRKDGKMKAWTMRHSHNLGSSRTEKRLSTGDVLMEDGKVKWHPVGVGPKGDALIADGTHGERTKLSPPIGNKKHQALGNPTLVGHRVPFKPTRNMRDVWIIPTMPHKEAHIAMFPEALVERCIRIGSRPGDTVLDCFGGSGTTGLVARQLGRNSVLMDISDEYVRMMKGRLSQETRGASWTEEVERRIVLNPPAPDKEEL